VRPSSYLNHVDIGDGTSLLFNGGTMCIDIVPSSYARALADKSSARDLSFLSPGETRHLLKRGHLTVLTPRQELAEFKRLARAVLTRSSELNGKRKRGNLSFILTYNCNLSCKYCYQKSVAGKARIPAMSGEFVEGLVSRYLPRMFPGVPKKNFIFLLFGGEPLLPANREAIASILRYAGKHSINVSTATNAITLPAMADLIGSEKGKIRNVQVTLDGDRLLHDDRRVPSSGKKTFDEMIKAVRLLMKLKAHVFIRVHTHPGRLDSAKRLVGYLQSARILNHPDVEVYFAPINTFHTEHCSPEDRDTFNTVFQKVASQTNRPPSLNLDFLNDILELKNKKFLPKVRFCSLGTDNLRIVDPLGDIYDCYEEAGHKDRRIGTLSEGDVKYFPLKKTYAARHLLNIPECLGCSMAFFCGGGCPNQARVQKGSLFQPYCLQNKEYIAQTLKAYYLGRRRRADAPSNAAPT
jgi:uncharacterized protein